jgi:hypothetical protein
VGFRVASIAAAGHPDDLQRETAFRSDSMEPRFDLIRSGIVDTLDLTEMIHGSFPCALGCRVTSSNTNRA